MKTVTEHIRHYIYETCGLIKPKRIDINSLYDSEWSLMFEKMMRNRLVLGAVRYGKLGDPCKPKYDRMGSIKKRIEIYKKTGNMELLVDIANLCLIEFEEGTHPTKHFCPLDDHDFHVEVLR